MAGAELTAEWRFPSQDGDSSPVYDMAKGLMTIQRAYGIIPRIIGKGNSAKVSIQTVVSCSAERCHPRR